jgi:hypothetical protein
MKAARVGLVKTENVPRVGLRKKFCCGYRFLQEFDQSKEQRFQQQAPS